VFIAVSVYFVIDSVRKVLDTPEYTFVKGKGKDVLETKRNAMTAKRKRVISFRMRPSLSSWYVLCKRLSDLQGSIQLGSE